MAAFLHNTLLKYIDYQLEVNASCVAFPVLASADVDYAHNNCLWATCLTLHAYVSNLCKVWLAPAFACLCLNSKQMLATHSWRRAGAIHKHDGIPSASNKILSLKIHPSPACVCRQQISNALEEVATASQQCCLLSQQHQAALSNPEPVVDQVRSHHKLLLLLHQQNVVFSNQSTYESCVCA